MAKTDKSFVEWIKNPLSKKGESFIALIAKFNKTSQLDNKFTIYTRLIKSYSQLTIEEATIVAKQLGHTLNELNDSISHLNDFKQAYQSSKKWKVLNKNVSNKFFNNQKQKEES